MTRGSYYLFRLPRDGGLLLAARPGQEPFAWEFQLKDPELERILALPPPEPGLRLRQVGQLTQPGPDWGHLLLGEGPTAAAVTEPSADLDRYRQLLRDMQRLLLR